MICSDCGRELRIGEWPFCPHGRPRGSIGRPAHVRERTVVYMRPGSKPIYPMSNNVPMPERYQRWGYERVELPTVRSLEKFERDNNVRNDVVWYDKGTGHADYEEEVKPIDTTGLEFNGAPLG